ncbi:MAG: anthranilate synthase component 2 [Maricaulis maris]|jgi:anthranilate synthase component 2|uniref:Anthranilate synthase, component II n=1 Tax=Maricaulis maris (strain MCS10) TaxID=394221 RepID=Q0APU4_MARMM|nr:MULTISPECIES: aminodeoxychorismate/anthranilate synthase component II [Maricaulis]ABI65693.1 anthranilate synthase, component II [Maricaulis maris MCS10]MAC88878.1 type 1 glutamine amidotransferase [Maricaulis sp.]
MLLIIDNYDSFTFNLVHYFEELGASTKVIRNDAMSVAEALALKPSGIVLSPGPCDPDRAGICLELIAAAPHDLPILGVCLGHQSIGQVFGGEVIAAKAIMHGKTSAVSHDGSGLFTGLPSPFTATRYHSLAVRPESLPDVLRATAHTADGEIMGLCHRDRPVHGVQFHPESIASEHGHDLLRNFLDLTGLPRAEAA